MTVVPDIDRDSFVEVWPGEATPEISILMPIFQQARYVAGAVNSILAQRGTVAEIIISDDNSTDDTFRTAREAVQERLTKHGSKHRIIIRHGSNRLRRDHLALLIDNAQCDIVCQAHADDESHPDRAKFIVCAFRSDPNVNLLASEALIINADGRVIGEQHHVTDKITASRLSHELVVKGHPFLIGFSQAWRRSSVSRFRRLDSSYAAASHDRILPFRASLTGDVLMLHAQLVKKRDHALAWHKMFLYEPGNEQFGWSLLRISALTVMKQDLLFAQQSGLVRDELCGRLMSLIDQLLGEFTTSMLAANRAHSRAGRHIAWVDDDTLRELRSTRRRSNFLEGIRTTLRRLAAGLP